MKSLFETAAINEAAKNPNSNSKSLKKKTVKKLTLDLFEPDHYFDDILDDGSTTMSDICAKYKLPDPCCYTTNEEESDSAIKKFVAKSKKIGQETIDIDGDKIKLVFCEDSNKERFVFMDLGYGELRVYAHDSQLTIEG